MDRLTEIPEWVDEISLHDGHKFMELHDKDWFQWNLLGGFAENEKNYQRFYGIWDGEDPIGYFMTKQKCTIENVNMIDGYIVEWGSKDESKLSEADIYMLAIQTFEKEVSDIIIGTVNENTVRSLSKFGFRFVSNEYILFKSNKDENKDIKDSRFWRLRLGYADTIFS